MGSNIDERLHIADNYTYGRDNRLTVDLHDIPANIRLNIDDIVRNHDADYRSQTDAIDALLYGK